MVTALLLSASLAVLTLATKIASAEEVCYPVLGCFNSDPPFDNVDGLLPEDPATVSTLFKLHTRENQEEPDDLMYMIPVSIAHSHFNSTRLTKFIIHGFANDRNTPWIADMRKALLEHGDYNVIAVYWDERTTILNYDQAVANVRLVATQLKVVIQLLQRLFGLQLADVHLIGHSLGAHVSGYAGSLLGGMVGRISGLDPADPYFRAMPEVVRLDQTDAQFVDVIHTNGARFQATTGFGLFLQSGHVDFYVNGGKTQRGCIDGIASLWKSWRTWTDNTTMVEAAGRGLSCSHSRSHQIYIESIQSPCKFRSFPCENFNSFLHGKCFDCGDSVCSEAGFHADKYPEAKGKHFLVTFKTRPYCGGNYYHFVIQHSPKQKGTKGDIHVKLLGESGDRTKGTRRIGLMGNDLSRIGGNDISSVIVLDKSLRELGRNYMAGLLYKRRTGTFAWFSRASRTFRIKAVMIKEVATGERLVSETKNWVLKNGKQHVIRLTKENYDTVGITG